MSESLQLDLLREQLIAAGLYLWLTCGVILILGLPIILLLLNRKGKRLVEEDRRREDG